MTAHLRTAILTGILAILGFCFGSLSGSSGESLSRIQVIPLALSVFLISLILSQVSFRALNLLRPSIPAFFYISYLGLIFFPGLIISSDRPFQNEYLWAISSVLLTIPTGVLLANLALRFKHSEARSFFEAPFQESEPSLDRRIVFCLFVAGAFALAGIHVALVQSIPLLYLIRNPGHYFATVMLREESFKLIGGPWAYVFQLLRDTWLPILFMISFGYYTVFKSTWWRNGTIFIGVLCLFYAGMTIAKMPVFACILMLLLFIYLKNRGSVGIFFYVKFIILLPVFPVFVIITQQGSSVAIAFQAILRRIFWVPANVLYYYFEAFPEVQSFLYGRSIRLWTLLTEQEHFRVANYMFHFRARSRLTSGLSNAAFIGNLHADFGFPGVVLGSILVGFLMQFIQIWIIRRGKNIENLVLQAFLSFNFGLLSIGALPSALFSGGILVALATPFLFYFLEMVVASLATALRNRTNQPIPLTLTTSTDAESR